MVGLGKCLNLTLEQYKGEHGKEASKGAAGNDQASSEAEFRRYLGISSFDRLGITAMMTIAVVRGF